MIVDSPLNVFDVFANPDFRASFGFDVGRAGQMIGVGMGFERPDDSKSLFFGRVQYRFHWFFHKPIRSSAASAFELILRSKSIKSASRVSTLIPDVGDVEQGHCLTK